MDEMIECWGFRAREKNFDVVTAHTALRRNPNKLQVRIHGGRFHLPQNQGKEALLLELRLGAPRDL